MKRLPQSFIIFREELNRLRLEKKKLKEEYEHQIQNINEELEYLREQLGAQHQMLANSIDYANRLEQQLEIFQSKMQKDKERWKESAH